ncbi:histidine--tRNA ligase [Candidatus Woesearchaeota archaeon]|nr:histidine--tRNA ligase [Candidatus Woesearchaeota archaeon]
MVMETMQIRLTKGLVEEIKMLVNKGIYPNSSECVRDAVRRLITGAGGKMEVPEAQKVVEKIVKEAKEQLQKPTGTTDFYPKEMGIRNKVFISLKRSAKRFGFMQVESPAFETIDLLTKKSGEEMLGQIFTLEQRGDEKFGLRFDLTVPITRMFLEKQKEIPKPVKWFGLSRMWRYERPQAGRLREFYQLSVELFGCDKPEADAEIINLAIDCLTSLKLTSNDFFVKINNRKLLQGLLLGAVKEEQLEAVIRIIDKVKKINDEEFERDLKNLKVDPREIKKILKCQSLEDVEKLKLNKQAKEGLQELKAIMQLVDEKFVKFDISVARGLAYYTGTVFEVYDKEEKFRALAGGGRYDSLVELYGGSPTPATGFGMGYSTLSLLLKEKELVPEPGIGVEYFVVIIGEEVREKALEIVKDLRKKYSVDYDLAGRNIKNQMNYADSVKAKKVIFIGGEEIESGMLTVKDMKTGKQSKVSIDIL